MKIMKNLILLTGLAGGMFAATAGFASGIPTNPNEPRPTAEALGLSGTNQPAATPAPNAAPVPDAAPPPTATTPTPPAPALAQPVEQIPQPAAAVEAAPATNAPIVVVVPAALVLVPTNSSAPATIIAQDTNTVVILANGEKGLRMNFRGVPLEAVLNYMSDAAGFIIHPNPKVDVRGKVDVWANQPLTSIEAVKLLKQILNENGYTAIQDGRTLTIIKSDDAKKSDIPVMSGNNPDKIPKNSDIVTQIIPVRSLNVVQLLKDLQPLVPTEATLTADESANSLVMTDTQMNIRRITEIVKALDSVTSSSATIQVFKLVYADSKSLASLIKDLFPSADASKNANSSSGGFSFGRIRGGGGGGGFPGFGGGGETSSDANGHTPTAKVSAVSDDHSNSLIVSAPEEMMETIAQLVKSVDTSVEDTSEVHVFHLKNADPVEMADLLTSLFPDDTSSTDATRAQPRISFGFGIPGAQPASSGSGESARMKKMGTVVAVADRRTASLVVTAGKDLMPAITNLVQDLDLRTDRKQSAHIIPLANADPVDVQQILQDIFQSSSASSRTGSSSSSSTTSNPLLNRQTTLLQQQNSTSSSSFGSGSGSGGGGSRTGL